MRKLTSILVVLDQSVTAARVLRRAVDLARYFDAALEVLAVEPVLAERMRAHCAGCGYVDVTVRGASRLGRRLDSVVLEHIRLIRPDLVIKARAGGHPLRRCSLTPNDWGLAQESPVSLMLVGPKNWANPPRMAAAVDVSDSDTLKVARTVMHTAGFLALGSHGNLDILYSERELNDSHLRMEHAVALAQLVREYHVGCERLQMFDGAPEKRLPPLITARRYDLLLLGATTHRDGLAETLFPLTARLVDATSGDVLLVKPEIACTADVRAARPLASEQLSHQAQQFV